jgi:NADH-quinone oxidoreductase subunit F
VQVLARIEAGGGTFCDLPLIEQVCNSMAATSFCPLAVGAAPPIISAIKEFKNEFENYIRRNSNADSHPPMKVSYPYLTAYPFVAESALSGETTDRNQKVDFERIGSNLS